MRFGKGRRSPPGRNPSRPQTPTTPTYHSTRLPRSSDDGSRTSGGRGAPKPSGWGHRWFRKTTRLVVVLACAGGFVFITTVDPNPKILTLSGRSDSNLLRSPESYQEVAKRLLSASLLNYSKITLDSSGFERSMKEAFPELSAATIRLPLLGRRPTVELLAEKPVLTLATPQGVHLMDKNGKVLIKASDAVGVDALGLPMVVDESNLTLTLGKGLLTKQEATFITSLIAQLQAGKLGLQSVTLPAIANELRIKPADQPFIMKFDMQNDPRRSAGAYFALKAKLDADHITPAEYIDLRLDERAFYK